MTKDTFIITRVDGEFKAKLIKLAGGARKLSAYIRRKLEEEIKKND